MTTPTPPAVSDAMREAVAPVTRAEVRACIGPTIPLRRRWVDLLMQGPIARLQAEIARLTGEREVAEMLLERRKVDLRAAEAETARLRAALEGETKLRKELEEIVRGLIQTTGDDAADLLSFGKACHQENEIFAARERQ